VKLTVLAIGKLRDAWVRAGCDEYLKRIRGKPAVEVVELRDASELERRRPPRARLWALDERGTQLTSEALAARLKQHMDRGESGIAFVIGGADGLPEDVVRAADFRWSLGALTLPHRLARLIVLEQIYRALSILRGEPYHRGNE
jgi:23S rRNA (pseudouridine1915-N3)-methyltransferase